MLFGTRALQAQNSRLAERCVVLQEENERLRALLSHPEERREKQWDNLLGYDGRRQPDNLVGGDGNEV